MDKQIKRYVLRKYVDAASIADAIKKDKETEVSDAWVEEPKKTDTTDAIGFNYDNE